MKESEQDPRLALRGRLIGLTGVLPTDPRFQEMSDIQMVFTVYWIEKVNADRVQHLERILGTYWDVEMARSILGKDESKGEKKSAHGPTSIRVPLSMAANADMYKLIKETFSPHLTSVVAGGDYRPEEGEQIMEIDPDMDKTDFLKRIGYFRQAREIMEREKNEAGDKERLKGRKAEIEEQKIRDLPPEMTAPLDQLFNLGTFSRGKDGGVIHKPIKDDTTGD